QTVTVNPIHTQLTFPPGPTITLNQPLTDTIPVTLTTVPTSGSGDPVPDEAVILTLTVVTPTAGITLSGHLAEQTSSTGVARFVPTLFSRLFGPRYTLSAQLGGDGGYLSTTAPQPPVPALVIPEAYRFELMRLQIAYVVAQVNMASLSTSDKNGLLNNLSGAESKRAAALADFQSHNTSQANQELTQAAGSISKAIGQAQGISAPDAPLWAQELGVVQDVITVTQGNLNGP